MQRLLHEPGATPVRDRWTLTARTAADDLRDLGFPAGDAGAGTSQGGTQTEDAGLETSETKDEGAELDAASADETQQPESRQGEEPFEQFGETDETDPNYKKRFVGSQRAWLKTKEQMEGLEAQNQTILATLNEMRRSTQRGASETTVPSGIAEESFTRLEQDLNGIDAKDPAARSKTIRTWVENNVKTAEQIATQRGTEAAQRVVALRDDLTKKTAVAKTKALDALKAVGLGEDYFPRYEKEVNHLIASTQGQWFAERPVAKQFIEIAELIKAEVDGILKQETVKANEQHRRSAGGVLGAGSRVNRSSRTTTKHDEPDRSFSQQMLDVQEQRKKDGASRFAANAAR